MSFAQSFTSFRKETLLQVLFKSLPASSLDFTQPSDINIPYIIYIYNCTALLGWTTSSRAVFVASERYEYQAQDGIEPPNITGLD